MAARTGGRKGRPWRHCQQAVYERDGDTCILCKHPGSGDTSHNLGLARAKELGVENNPDYCSPIHGANSGCPLCPPRWSRKAKRMVRRNCNGEVGSKPIAEVLAQARRGDREW